MNSSVQSILQRRDGYFVASCVGSISVIVVRSGQYTSGLSSLDRKRIHVLTICEHVPLPTLNRSQRKSFGRPSRSFVSTTTNSSLPLRFLCGPHFCGDRLNILATLVLVTCFVPAQYRIFLTFGDKCSWRASNVLLLEKPALRRTLLSLLINLGVDSFLYRLVGDLASFCFSCSVSCHHSFKCLDRMLYCSH